MSVTVYNEPIPAGKLGQFDSILKNCGGRYLCPPLDRPDRWGRYRVSYHYDEATAAVRHTELWSRVTRDVSERRRDQWWRVALRRLFGRRQRS